MSKGGCFGRESVWGSSVKQEEISEQASWSVDRGVSVQSKQCLCNLIAKCASCFPSPYVKTILFYYVVSNLHTFNPKWSWFLLPIVSPGVCVGLGFPPEGRKVLTQGCKETKMWWPELWAFGAVLSVAEGLARAPATLKLSKWQWILIVGRRPDRISSFSHQC